MDTFQSFDGAIVKSAKEGIINLVTKNTIEASGKQVGKETLIALSQKYADNGLISQASVERFKNLNESEIAGALKLAINGVGAWIDDLPKAYSGLKTVLKENEFNNDLFKLFDAADPADQIVMADSWMRLKSNSFVRTDATRFEKFQKFNETNQELISQFTDAEASSILSKFLDDVDNPNSTLTSAFFNNKPGTVDSWKKIHLHNPNSYLKTDVARLEIFHSLSDKNQDLVKLFTDVDEGSTLSKFLDDFNDNDFIGYLNDNPDFVESFVGHKTGGGLSDLELRAKYDLAGEEIRGTRVPDEYKLKLEEWVDRSSDLKSFGKYTEKGNILSTNIHTSLSSRSGVLFDDLATKLNIDPEVLKSYDIYKEVPLYTEGGFMKTDIVLVKKTPDGIEDVIVIENKLSVGTDYTVRQKEGWKKLANGEDLNVKSTVYGKDAAGNSVELTVSTSLPNNKVRPYKMNDHGETIVDNVDINPVQVNNYKNYKYTPRQ